MLAVGVHYVSTAFPFFQIKKFSKIWEKPFDFPAQAKMFACSLPLKKQKHPFRGANVFTSGSGGNRTPVQKGVDE